MRHTATRRWGVGGQAGGNGRQSGAGGPSTLKKRVAELTRQAAFECELDRDGQRRTALTAPHCQSAIWSTRQSVSLREETTSTTRLQPSE